MQIREARARLGYRTIAEFAGACGLGERTIGDLETGRRDTYSPTTLSRVEATLGWAEGSIERTVEGRRPIRGHDPELQLILDAWPHLSRDARRMLANLVRDLR